MPLINKPVGRLITDRGPVSWYIGIDPGVNGGIVTVSKQGHHIYAPTVIPMPSTERDVWDWVRNIGWVINRHETGITGSGYYQPRHAVIEWIHPAIKGAGKSSMSKLYGNYMALRMSLTAADIPFDVVMPKKWQASLDISSRKKSETVTQWKDRLRAKAQQLWPGLEIWNSTLTRQRAISDALLLCTYCIRNS